MAFAFFGHNFVHSKGGFMDELLTVPDIMRLTHFSVGTVYVKAKSGEIPGKIKLGPRCIRFRKSVIESWLNGYNGIVKKDEA